MRIHRSPDSLRERPERDGFHASAHQPPRHAVHHRTSLIREQLDCGAEPNAGRSVGQSWCSFCLLTWPCWQMKWYQRFDWYYRSFQAYCLMSIVKIRRTSFQICSFYSFLHCAVKYFFSNPFALLITSFAISTLISFASLQMSMHTGIWLNLKLLYSFFSFNTQTPKVFPQPKTPKGGGYHLWIFPFPGNFFKISCIVILWDPGIEWWKSSRTLAWTFLISGGKHDTNLILNIKVIRQGHMIYSNIFEFLPASKVLEACQSHCFNTSISNDIVINTRQSNHRILDHCRRPLMSWHNHVTRPCQEDVTNVCYP